MKFIFTVPKGMSINIQDGGNSVSLMLLSQMRKSPIYILKVGIKGDKGDNGQVTTYRVDFTDQLSVQVNHGLGIYPIVQVFNSNNELVLVTPKHINNNRFDLIFNVPVTGYVIY